MYRLIGGTMDQSRDLNGQQLYRIVRTFPAPEFVKTASTVELCGEKLGSHMYADPVRRLFPCHTPAATWTSAAFFLTKKADFSPEDQRAIEDRLSYFGNFHQIGKQIHDLHEKAAALKPKEATISDDDFAIVIKERDGTVTRKYPIRNGMEIKAATDYLHKYRDEMPFRVRQEIAEKILQKAASLGVTLGDSADFVEKQAGYGACSAKDCASLITGRVIASRKGPGPDGELQLEMLKLAKIILEKPSQLRQSGSLYKVAEIIDNFDRNNRLQEYGPAFPRLEDVLFGVTREKMASVSKDYTTTITGSIYRLEDLERVKLAEVQAWFGEDIAESVTSDGLRVDSEKAAEVLPTLPRGDAELFDRMMSDLGLQPAAKEASHYTTGLSRDFLKELAKLHQPG
jgi:hypothetical protein